MLVAVLITGPALTAAAQIYGALAALIHTVLFESVASKEKLVALFPG